MHWCKHPSAVTTSYTSFARSIPHLFCFCTLFSLCIFLLSRNIHLESIHVGCMRVGFAIGIHHSFIDRSNHNGYGCGYGYGNDCDLKWSFFDFFELHTKNMQSSFMYNAPSIIFTHHWFLINQSCMTHDTLWFALIQWLFVEIRMSPFSRTDIFQMWFLRLFNIYTCFKFTDSLSGILTIIITI